MNKYVNLEEEKLYVPVKFLKQVYEQLKSDAYYQVHMRSTDGIRSLLKRLLEKMKTDNDPLYTSFSLRSISVSNLDRAFLGQKGGMKVNVDYEVKYELLDFLCYAGMKGRSLPEVLSDPERDWGTKTKYTVNLPGYVMEFLNSSLPSTESITGKSNPELAEPTAGPLLINLSNNKFTYINQEFWDKLRGKRTNDELIDYYRRADTKKMLPYILVSHEDPIERLYIQPENEMQVIHRTDGPAKMELSKLLEKIVPDNRLLIKILGEGGEGKSSFLLHIAREFFEKFNILKCIDNNEIDDITGYLPKFNNDKPVIILLDNVMNHKNNLGRYANSLDIAYYERGYSLFISERKNRYAKDDYFENHFDNVYTIDFHISLLNQELFFQKLIVNKFITIPEDKIETEKQSFISSDQPLRIRVRSLLRTFGIKDERDIQEDWRDWDYFIAARPQYAPLGNLYNTVALFTKFGFSVPLQMKMLLHPYVNDSGLVLKAISETVSSPFQIENGEFIRLRHDTEADDYFEIEQHQSRARLFLSEFLESLSEKHSASLFRNLQESIEFRDDIYFSPVLNDTKRISILNEYYVKTQDDSEKGKTATRLALALIRNEELEKAVELLRDLLKKDTKNVRAKTLLASLYLRSEFGLSEEAESLLYEVLLLEKTNIYAIEKLIELYTQKSPDVHKLDELLETLCFTLSFKARTYQSIITRYIAANYVIEAWRYIKIYLEKYPGSDASLFYDRILKKTDSRKSDLAAYLIGTGEITEAEKILYSIKDKAHIAYKISLSKLLFAKGRFENIVPFLETERKKDPHNTAVLYILAKCYNRLNQIEFEAGAIADLLEIRPYDQEIMEWFRDLFLKRYHSFYPEEYEKIESALLKLLKTHNTRYNQFTLVLVYEKWFHKNFLLMKKGKLDPISYFLPTFQLLPKAILLLEGQEYHSRFRSALEKQYNEAPAKYRILLNSLKNKNDKKNR